MAKYIDVDGCSQYWALDLRTYVGQSVLGNQVGPWPCQKIICDDDIQMGLHCSQLNSASWSHD